MYINIDHIHLQLRRRPWFRALCQCALAIPFACLVMLFVAGVAKHAAAGTPPVILTEQDSGKTIEIELGKNLFVQLPSNPTTGYQWRVLGSAAPLEFVKSDYATDPQAAGRAGAGGTQTLQFTAKSPGKVELKLGYRRPWEKDVPPVKTFAATIVVK